MKRLILLAALLPSPVAAAPFANLAEVDRAATDFAGAPAVPVDRRMRLEACRVPFSLSWYGTRRDTVLVQCPSPAWRLFVPLQGGGAAALSAPLVVKGDAVSITISGAGFAVSQPGEALESGAEGAWIKVRSVAVGAAPVRARVLRPGIVGMDLP